MSSKILSQFREFPFIFFFFFFFIYCCYSLVGLALAAKPTDCDTQKCGNIPSISYPFWLNGKQPSYCGYPPFEINCRNNTPVLRILSQDYYIKDINYKSQSVLVINNQFLDHDCWFPPFNLTLGLSPFISISTSNKELFFFSNCTRPKMSDSSVITCAGSKTFAYLGGDDNLLEQHLNLSSTCVPSVAPILGSARTDVGNYSELLKDGFLFSWSETDCSECRDTNGTCGYDTQKEKFMCICADRTHLKNCSAGASASASDSDRKDKKAIIRVVATGVGGFLLASALGIVMYLCGKRRLRSLSSKLFFRASSESSIKTDPEIGSSRYQTHIFDYSELEEATNNFDPSKELGDGGFGTVYQGKLQDGRIVAVKRLYENNYKRVEQFVNEVEILSLLRHPNLVTLYGCTSRRSRELLLVYEFIPNGTVADHLHGPRASERALTWPIRMNIAIQTADALAYLHTIEPQIIHRDVKTNNILLDSSFHVKVADFGLSRLFPADATHVSTAPQGTPGYLDPEYHQCYQLTDKSDVYSFGVVLVELISSKPAVDISRHRHEINLSNMAIIKIQNCELDQFVDSELGFESDWEIRMMMTMVAELAFRCLQGEREMRPPIKEVLEVLRGIESGGYKVDKAVESDAGVREDTSLLKNTVPFSPDSVTENWESRNTTPNTSK